jgi:hypothetical protein
MESLYLQSRKQAMYGSLSDCLFFFDQMERFYELVNAQIPAKQYDANELSAGFKDLEIFGFAPTLHLLAEILRCPLIDVYNYNINYCYGHLMYYVSKQNAVEKLQKIKEKNDSKPNNNTNSRQHRPASRQR